MKIITPPLLWAGNRRDIAVNAIICSKCSNHYILVCHEDARCQRMRVLPEKLPVHLSSYLAVIHDKNHNLESLGEGLKFDLTTYLLVNKMILR
jgi:hypothetical protein